MPTTRATQQQAAHAIATRILRWYNRNAVGASRPRCHGAGSGSYAAPLFCPIAEPTSSWNNPLKDIKNQPPTGRFYRRATKIPRCRIWPPSCPRQGPILMNPTRLGRGQLTGAILARGGGAPYLHASLPPGTECCLQQRCHCKPYEDILSSGFARP
jgi:hypothetical protein